MKKIFAIISLAMMSACSTFSPPIPEDYKGPTATIADTVEWEGASKGRLFVLSELAGEPVKNAIHASREASYGRGFSLTLMAASREIPARPTQIVLMGTHQTAAPIHEIASRALGTFFSVEGQTAFSPVPGGKYLVTGELTAKKSCVWVEEVGTQAMASGKVCAE